MPQFDITTYSSQIFWFAICFGLLYFFVSRVILPRIQNVLTERNLTIELDLTSAKILEDKIENLQIENDSIQKSANQKYQSRLEEAYKKASLQRENTIEELKVKIDNMTKKSRQEIKTFTQKAKIDSESTVKSLIEVMRIKFFD